MQGVMAGKISGGVYFPLFEPTLEVSTNDYLNSTRPGLLLQEKEVATITACWGRLRGCPCSVRPAWGRGSLHGRFGQSSRNSRGEDNN